MVTEFESRQSPAPNFKANVFTITPSETTATADNDGNPCHVTSPNTIRSRGLRHVCTHDKHIHHMHVPQPKRRVNQRSKHSS